MPNRFALIIASYKYEDESLKQLVAPAQDAENLAETLGDPNIGGFDVQNVLINESSHTANMAIEAFFNERKRDDLLLLYFSGHGIKDENGELYYATPDTRRKMLRTSAIPSTLINDVMRLSNSRRQVLLLDCCHSGAFAKGMVAKGSKEIGSKAHLEGRGRVVLTASDAMQYAFEGDKIEGEGVSSLFTQSLVEGLKSGEADRDGDGNISLEELYDYTYDQVVDKTPNQRPEMWAFGVKGEIIIAKNPKPVIKGVELPSELEDSIIDSRTWVREGAVRELDRLLHGSHRGLAQAAREKLEILSNDDSRRVSEMVKASLEVASPKTGIKPTPPAKKKKAQPKPKARAKPPLVVAEEKPKPKPKPEPPPVVEEEKPKIPPPVKKEEKPRPRLIRKFRLPAKVPIWAWGVVGIVAVGLLIKGFMGGGAISEPTDTPAPTPLGGGAISEPTDTPGSTPLGGGSGKIAFISGRDGNKEIYVMDVDGSNLVRLINNAEDDWDPAWSPDVGKIAFDSDQDGNFEIYVMDADGGNLVRLINNEVDDYGPAWSPDGQKIAFVSERDGNPEIYVMDSNGSNPVRLTNNGIDDQYPAWSPDGEKIAFSSDRYGNWGIFVMDADGGNPVSLTNNGVDDLYPAWSPDGEKIAFYSNRDGNHEIYVMDADGGSPVRLTSNDAYDRHPAWSPDGEKIAFSSFRDGNWEIYVMDADGDNQTRLTNNEARDWDPAWAP